MPLIHFRVVEVTHPDPQIGRNLHLPTHFFCASSTWLVFARKNAAPPLRKYGAQSGRIPDAS